ncbi:MAG: response regulator transcription factor [Muribaculaceae bacterium]|nr:response regulator transcription factor [Muribaculaceae bacterium]MDD6868670.1 response regulator transcription factor [bacterium]MDY5826971.1 response regulator transcription factor [Candidatus Limisoma sp.]
MDIRQKILVVDDEQSICELMKINLEIAGYDVDIAYSAEDALRLNLEEYALMVFDIMMGNISGLQLVSMVRQMPKIANVPIIVCTALSEERPLVEGFSRGADDYIKKPFSMKEFVLRVKSLLRRTSKTINNSNVSYKSLTLDNSSKLCYIDGKEVALTKKEFDILYLLISNPGKVFSREEILQTIWEKNVYVVDRTIDVNINRLRKKLGEYESNIVTRQGYGYGFKENI